MHENPRVPSVVDPLVLLWGASWQGAAVRAVFMFLLGYILPRMLAGHAVPGVQWPATLLCIGLTTLALLRFIKAHESATPGETERVVLLADAAVSPATLDAVVMDTGPQSVRKPRKWSIELLHELEWKRMAEVCLAFYKDRGLHGELESVGPDGSVDVRLYQQPQEPGDTEVQAAFALLHCKARGEQIAGTESVLALNERMVSAGISRAFFMGAWSFDEAAQAAAKPLQITLVDDRMFLSMISRLPHDESQRLLNLAVEGDYMTPSCPACGLKMIPRQSELGRYWGCRAFPLCKATLGMQA